MSQSKPTTEELWNTTHLGSDSSVYLETLYENYLENPDLLDDKWRSYFDALPKVNGNIDSSHRAVQEQFLNLAKSNKSIVVQNGDSEHEHKQVKVLQMINGFRTRGHQHANVNPLHLNEKPHIDDLDLKYYGLTQADFNTQFHAGSLVGPERATLADIYNRLQQTYCDSVGVEYMHITDSDERRWLQQRLEGVCSHPDYAKDVKLNLLRKVNAAEGMEKYLHTKYVGQKRFSLEGGESLIPLLDELIQRSGAQGIKEIGIGMAHRGRLNVLINILGKVPNELFEEFEGKRVIDETSSGDVKYHQGFSSDVRTPGGDVHLALAFNPSHLEIVSPVVEGSVRARQERRSDKDRKQVLPINIHGDSAFAGQGVVMETFSMSQARGYKTGGTVHIVVNNQIGFTTSNPLDTRSTLYCTDVAKMVQCPIFHVNSDDPEAVLMTAQVALDYRMTFKKDVVIDLVCYRRHGHNEADEPSATQPMMYQIIRKHATTRQLYAERLVAEGVVSDDEVKQLAENYRQRLQEGVSMVDELQPTCTNEFAVDWQPFLGHDWNVTHDTSYDKKHFQQLADKLLTLPEGFTMQAQVKKIMGDRAKMAKGEHPIDWGFAETMAYATLLEQGNPIRLSGQDCGRGTFAHRHAVLHDQKTGESYVPLQNLSQKQPNYLVIDSLLSEEAVLGFEYGYATADPLSLVIWEAQFGDFANGAQVVIDQFISSGEQKWNRMCGLVMLLPHGYEGMGPEHSSARLERYLQLCAEHNIQVCTPTTPAQCFHMLRRQAIRPYRKPLVVMSPKSLLRHKLAVSTLDDLCNGRFMPVIADDTKEVQPKKARKVILTSGKVYYDLLSKRREAKIDDVAIIRIEQLYPFPKEEFKQILAEYSHVDDVVWCQEEPRNQGAWYCTLHHLTACLHDGAKVSYAGRPSSASPAVGHAALHQKQQIALVEAAFAKS